MSEAARRCVTVILADIAADGWLASQFMERLRKLPTYGERRLASEEGVLNGKTFFPCVRQLYMLRHSPFVDGQLILNVVGDLAANSGYNLWTLKNYYQEFHGERLPQAFIRNILHKTTGISKTSADSVINVLRLLKLVEIVDGLTDSNNSRDVLILDDLKREAEEWAKLKYEALNGGARDVG